MFPQVNAPGAVELPHTLEILLFLCDISDRTHQPDVSLLLSIKCGRMKLTNEFVTLRVELLMQPQDLICNMSCAVPIEAIMTIAVSISLMSELNGDKLNICSESPVFFFT